MAYRRILVITDNEALWTKFRLIVDDLGLPRDLFSYRCSPQSAWLSQRYPELLPLNLRVELERLLGTCDLVISVHCKQLFPPELVRSAKCINVHPGLNPFNRGWYPQVFSILNKLPLGATIHEIDEQLDHGAIIAQREVPLFPWDTSLTAYERVQEAEVALLREHLRAIVDGSYATSMPQDGGNVNYQRDFKRMCHLDLAETGTLGKFVDRLRALTHGEFKNAYFLDSSGRKVFVRLVLEPENPAEAEVARRLASQSAVANRTAGKDSAS